MPGPLATFTMLRIAGVTLHDWMRHHAGMRHTPIAPLPFDEWLVRATTRVVG